MNQSSYVDKNEISCQNFKLSQLMYKFRTRKYCRGIVFKITMTKYFSMIIIEHLVGHLHTQFPVRDEENVQKASLRSQYKLEFIQFYKIRSNFSYPYHISLFFTKI